MAQIHSDTSLAGYRSGPRGLPPAEPNRHQALKAAAASDRIYFVATDHLGTPQELVDETGALAWQARYRAWGRIAHEDGTGLRQPLRFQGQYEDEETGLYYNRHRYYDPDSGRYVTPDPIGLLGGENAYQYAPNATGWVDPLGLCRGRTGASPTGFDEVADYVSENGELPDNFITKSEARKLGWNPKAGNLDEVAPGKSIGGDIFHNRDGALPSAPGRVWREADINYTSGYRGGERLLYSSDGLIYKTSDHYRTFAVIAL